MRAPSIVSSLVALAAVVACACRSEPAPELRPAAPATARVEPRAGSAARDPWAAQPAAADDPPSLSERHALADKACPHVDHPFLFSVEKDHQTAYILGSRHVGVSLAKMPAFVRARVQAAKLAVFEVAPGDDNHPKPREIDLRDALGPELWQRYTKLVGEAVAASTEHASPSAALLDLMIMYEDAGATLDMEIEKQVQDAHVATRGLESARFQDDLIEKLLDLRALRAIVSQTKDRAEIAEQARNDLEKYCQGTSDKAGTSDADRAKMRAAGYTDKEIDAEDEELVFARNAKWIPELETMFAHDDVLVVVGADHLIGPRGVPALLAARGYHVARVDH